MSCETSVTYYFFYFGFIHLCQLHYGQPPGPGKNRQNSRHPREERGGIWEQKNKIDMSEFLSKSSKEKKEHLSITANFWGTV
jgi:hypothetical protein